MTRREWFYNSALAVRLFAAETPAPSAYGPRLYFHARFWNTPGWKSRDGDYAYLQLTPGPNALAQIRNILGSIPPRHRLILTTALQGMDEILHQLIEVQGFGVGCLGYDVEGWELTPDAEKNNPVQACQAGQALAHKYGLPFLACPTRQLGEKFGLHMAPYVDLMKVQDKGRQAQDIDAAIAEQRDLYQRIRAANPKVVLYHDMATVPKRKPQTLAQLLRYYRGLADLVGGIGMWSLESHRRYVEPFLRAIRPPIGLPSAIAPGEGPRMTFSSYHWKFPGWEPRPGDYGLAHLGAAQPTDSVVRALQDVPPEQRMVLCDTIAGAGDALHEIIEVRGFKLACLGYAATDFWKSAQQLAGKYKLEFVATPTSTGAKQARSIDDAIVTQRKLYTQIRLANPDITLYHDAAIRPLDDLLRYYAGVADLVDGICIHFQNTPEETIVLEKYVLAIRPPVAKQR